MSYTLSIATRETRDLVVESLRAAADQRTRVARGAARQVAAAKAGGTDVRSRSVKVTALLAEAGDLAELADQLEAAEDLVIVSTTTATAPVTTVAIGRQTAVTKLPGAPEAPAGTVDDGTSPAAQALAELAGLTPADPDAVEDPVTGALPEDEPAQPEEVLA